jgi:hypothetical protein
MVVLRFLTDPAVHFSDRDQRHCPTPWQSDQLF